MSPSSDPMASATSVRPAHRPSARDAMLDAAEAHLGADGTLSLDSAARAAGVTKPGLMYHFATKEQLLTAILDRLAARYEQEMAEAVSTLVERAPAGRPPAGAVLGSIDRSPSDGAPEEGRPADAQAGAGAGTHDAVFAEATAPQRFLAYLEWAGRASLSSADLVIFADPKLRVALTQRWQEQMDRWLDVPAGTSVGLRRRLLAVRLLADGLWFDRASGLLETSAEEAVTLRKVAVDLLGGDI